MKNHEAEFVKSVHRLADLPADDLPQIAFAGRSNVGKSSLLNTLLNQKKLAKTSSTPGKTRSLNFYLIDRQFYLVDLPGYGFAKVSREEKKRWKRLIEEYLTNARNLRGAVLIVDSRIGLTELDEMMLGWFSQTGLPFRVVATKIDKLNRGERTRQLRKINRRLEELEVALALPFSSKTKEGKPDVWKTVEAFLAETEA